MNPRRKLRFLLQLAVAVFLLSAPIHRARATGYTQEIWVYSNYCGQSPCIVGPHYCNVLVGQWMRQCDGSLTGGGEEPGTSCTYTVYGAITSCE